MTELDKFSKFWKKEQTDVLLKRLLISLGFEKDTYLQGDCDEFDYQEWMDANHVLPSVYEYKEWDALKNEICSVIDDKSADEISLSKWICAILISLKPVASLFFNLNPKEEYDIFPDLISYLLDSTNNKTEIPLFISQRIEQDVYDEIDFGLIDDENLEDEICKRTKLFTERVKTVRCGTTFRCIQSIRNSLSRLSALLEAALIENQTENDLFDYQKKCGVTIVTELTPKQVSKAVDWTTDYVISLLNGRKMILEQEEENIFHDLSPQYCGGYYGWLRFEPYDYDGVKEQNNKEEFNYVEDFISVYGEDGYALKMISAYLKYMRFVSGPKCQIAPENPEKEREAYMMYEECSLFSEFDYWAQLYNQISRELKNKIYHKQNVDDYIFKLVEPLYSISRYIHPAFEDDVFIYASKMIDAYAFHSNDKVSIFRERWMESRSRVIDSYNYTKNYDKDIYDNIIQDLDNNISLNRDKQRDNGSVVFENLYFNVNAYEEVIECALLENKLQKDVFYYYDYVGVRRQKSISSFDLSQWINWREEKILSRARELGHRIYPIMDEEFDNKSVYEEDMEKEGINLTPNIGYNPLVASVNMQQQNADSQMKSASTDTKSRRELIKKETSSSSLPEKRGWLSEIMKEYIKKVPDLIVNDVWQGTTIKEYAIFLKALHCAVYKKEESNNVSWKKMCIFPMKNGIVPSNTQLSNAIRQYDCIQDASIMEKYKKMLAASIEE